MLNERTIHLRIKIKHLAEEARINRAEAKRARGMVKWDLNHHRKTVIRLHSRHNLLAYGLVRGVPYEVIELKCRKEPNWKKVSSIAERFGATAEGIAAWIYAGKEYVARPKEAKAA